MPPAQHAAAPRQTAAIDVAGVPNLRELMRGGRPVILRGAARNWTLVNAALASDDAAISELIALDGGRPLTRYVASAEVNGRFFYSDAMTGLNFTAEQVSLTQHLRDIRAEAGAAAPRALYVGSTDVDAFLPRLRRGNDLHADFGPMKPIVSIWIGNRTVAATHYDTSDNLAVCVMGRRRFTLFPPEQITNLYPGPLEPTPGGQVVSMADPSRPDLVTYPRFAEALAAAEVADLGPEDILFYPALWWHQVEAVAAVNVMVNYWWNDAPPFADPPAGALLHAMLSLRDRPDHEKAAWRAMFDHYVFGDAGAARDHLPVHVQGRLALLSDASARRLRANLLARLAR